MQIDASMTILSGPTVTPPADGGTTGGEPITPLTEPPVEEGGRSRGPKGPDRSHRSEAAVVSLSRNAQRIAEKFAAREGHPIDVPHGLARWLPAEEEPVTEPTTEPAPAGGTSTPIAHEPVGTEPTVDEPMIGAPALAQDTTRPILADLSGLRIDLVA